MRNNRYIISGGGTGGHIFPAVAIAQEIKRRNPAAEILFIGAAGRMEMEKVPQAGFPIIGLPISGLQRKLDWRNVLLPFKLVFSLVLAYKHIKKFKPGVVIGVGGYASAPTLRIANLIGIPTVIQEQNSFAGKTNIWLSKKATKICVAYENMHRFFPANKIVLTGNPLRFTSLDLQMEQNEALGSFGLKSGKPTLLFVGGSLGARSINESVELFLNSLLEFGFQVIWQTGKHYKIKNPNQSGVWVNSFIVNMPVAYCAADIIVSRAGAMSISELSLVGKPSIFVPSPYVAEDHQTHNARALVDNGAASMIREQDVRETLYAELVKLWNDPGQRMKMSLKIKEFARSNATEHIVNEIEKL